MALRRWSRDRWEAELRALGCRPIEGLTKLNTAEWWQYPFGGYPVTVPVDEDGYADYWAFTRIVEDYWKLAPEGWAGPEGDA